MPAPPPLLGRDRGGPALTPARDGEAPPLRRPEMREAPPLRRPEMGRPRLRCRPKMGRPRPYAGLRWEGPPPTSARAPCRPRPRRRSRPCRWPALPGCPAPDAGPARRRDVTRPAGPRELWKRRGSGAQSSPGVQSAAPRRPSPEAGER